ncbi:DUF4863 family protein [Pseudomonas citronellolis]|uniref:4-hydroxylaminobenzoate lyase n=1 Tax=Pseudomonas citronellolis TaxID=53408 RepID=UPI0007184BF6|nr:DUF4863 family protein [Pseudomonas citronellolis]KRV80012.1 PnbB [Pseudomonas citronellolis]KRW75260.1 PnbB [Pseudomonas citronellolis]
METPPSASQQALLARCIPFLEIVKDMTPGSEVEAWLNHHYGPDSTFFQDVARLIRLGVEVEGWAANVEIQGRRYRRSRIAPPSETTFGFSVTAVYMDSRGSDQGNPEGSFRGDYHAHPYGEFNMVIPLDEGAALAGPSGWCHAGWTAPAPGSRHYPEAKGGAVIALFFLPAGRIAYNVKAPEA